MADVQVLAAVQPEGDAVNFIGSGISQVDPDDHGDFELLEPAGLDGALTGPRPFHTVDHDG